MNPRYRNLVLAATVIVAAFAFATGARAPILRGIGHVLVTDESATDRVDVIVVGIDVGTAGLLEAADLVHRGIATKVAAFARPLSKADLEPVQIRIARFDDVDPNSWWQLRDGSRVVITEIQKLLLDFVQHPFS